MPTFQKPPASFGIGNNNDIASLIARAQQQQQQQALYEQQVMAAQQQAMMNNYKMQGMRGDANIANTLAAESGLPSQTIGQFSNPGAVNDYLSARKTMAEMPQAQVKSAFALPSAQADLAATKTTTDKDAALTQEAITRTEGETIKNAQDLSAATRRIENYISLFNNPNVELDHADDLVETVKNDPLARLAIKNNKELGQKALNAVKERAIAEYIKDQTASGYQVTPQQATEGLTAQYGENFGKYIDDVNAAKKNVSGQASETFKPINPVKYLDAAPLANPKIYQDSLDEEFAKYDNAKRNIAEPLQLVMASNVKTGTFAPAIGSLQKTLGSFGLNINQDYANGKKLAESLKQQQANLNRVPGLGAQSNVELNALLDTVAKFDDPSDAYRYLAKSMYAGIIRDELAFGIKDVVSELGGNEKEQLNTYRDYKAKLPLSFFVKDDKGSITPRFFIDFVDEKAGGKPLVALSGPEKRKLANEWVNEYSDKSDRTVRNLGNNNASVNMGGAVSGAAAGQPPAAPAEQNFTADSFLKMYGGAR